jgi:putative transposase
VVAVLYERDPAPAAVNASLYAGVDMGLNTLALLTSNKAGFVPRLVNGRPVKSINQVYNKRRAQWQSKLGTRGTSRHLERITTKRTRRIEWYLYAVASYSWRLGGDVRGSPPRGAGPAQRRPAAD